MSSASGEFEDETHEVRSRAPSRKGFQNILLDRTSAFNKVTKNLQRDIERVNTSIESPEKLEEAAEALKEGKEYYERLVDELEQLFLQDKCGESVTVKPTVRSVSKRYLEAVGTAISQASSKIKSLPTKQKSISRAVSSKPSMGLKLPQTEISAGRGRNESKSPSILSQTTKRSRNSVRTSSSRSSLQSERTKALAEVAAAKEQAEHDLLMAEKENARKCQQAQEELQRATAQAQHEHDMADMAVLTARKLEAVAEAGLDAIDHSIEQEGSVSLLGSWRSSNASSQRTLSWVQSQNTQAEEKIHQEEERIMTSSNPHTTSQSKPPTLQQTHALEKTQQPIDVVQQYMGAMATTNQRLTASLARLSLPKCHPDVLSADATMFLPWKSAFKGMIEGCDVTPENEMNYLCSYTAGEPQRLVNSYRKRRHKNLQTLVKDLWQELERRFGNVAVITNAFLSKLKEAAKFEENDRKKLQTFSDLCLDAASQVSQLPGLACLNYPNTIRPILYNLPESLRIKWDKQVVEFTSKNHEAYPSFSLFASMIEKQSLFKNHRNVTAIEKRPKGDHRKPFFPPLDPLKVLKGDTTTEEEDSKKAHCMFHKCSTHTLSECNAFARKTLDEKTDWIRQEKLCFRCLPPNHIARQCKSKVKCETCGSERHPTLLHKVVETNNEDEEIISTQTGIGHNADRNYSCGKIVLLKVSQGNDLLNTRNVYAIIDEQSNASMISPELVDELGIDGPKEKYFLSTCIGSKDTKFGWRVSGVMVTSIKGGKPLKLPALIECDNIPEDKTEIPTPDIAKRYDHLRDIAGGILPLDKEAKVQLLIGRNSPELLKVRAFRNGPKGAPWAHRLAVGWRICGQPCIDRQGGAIHISTHRTVCKDRTEPSFGQAGAELKRETSTIHPKLSPCRNNFTVQESFVKSQGQDDVYRTTDCDNEPTMSIDDRRFVEIMESQTHKNQTGHWEMPLPLCSNDLCLPNNRENALTRMKGLLRSFKRKSKLEQDYFDFMAKLLERGHAVPVAGTLRSRSLEDANTNRKKVWYLPHFGVYHPRKLNKIRVVFDSSSEFKGASLNKEILPSRYSIASMFIHPTKTCYDSCGLTIMIRERK